MTQRRDTAYEPATADLLIEIGCEELPPKALDELRDEIIRLGGEHGLA